MDQVEKTRETNDKSKNKLIWLVLKWLILILVFGLLIYFGTLPARGRLSEKYRRSGDQFLLQKRYLSADLEYRKALMIDKNNRAAADNRRLAAEGSGDVLTLQNFVERNDSMELAIFNLATEVPADESEAVLTAKKLLEAGEYQLAALPAKTATEMDQSYGQAWLYLGLANLKSAQMLETTNDRRLEYKNRAKAALKQAQTLDPENQLAIKLLDTM